MPQRPHDRLARQSAIVTGSSSGIGAAVAVALAREGANVTVNYHSDEDGGRATVEAIRAANPDVETILVGADTSSEKDVERLFAETVAAFGHVDVVVANAGIQRDARTHEMTLDEWGAVLAVNLTGPFLIARAAIRRFLEQGVREGVSKAAGKIICMSSVHDVIPWAGHANYAAAKGGLKLLMETLAQEYGPSLIRVNSLSPGAIATDINKDVWDNPATLKPLLGLIPYGRIGQPDDIGAAAAWLASDESDYVTGTTLYVDGAMTNYPEFADNG